MRRRRCSAIWTCVSSWTRRRRQQTVSRSRCGGRKPSASEQRARLRPSTSASDVHRWIGRGDVPPHPPSGRSDPDPLTCCGRTTVSGRRYDFGGCDSAVRTLLRPLSSLTDSPGRPTVTHQPIPGAERSRGPSAALSSSRLASRARGQGRGPPAAISRRTMTHFVVRAARRAGPSQRGRHDVFRHHDRRPRGAGPSFLSNVRARRPRLPIYDSHFGGVLSNAFAARRRRKRSGAATMVSAGHGGTAAGLVFERVAQLP